MFAGRMFVRRARGNKAILVAIIDYPEGSDLQDEALHDFYGSEDKDGKISLTTTHRVQDVSKLAEGNNIDGILTSSIWSTWNRVPNTASNSSRTFNRERRH